MEKKKPNPRIIPAGRTQVNFNIKDETLEKVKALSYQEGVTNSEVFNRATETYIELYEKKHGKLKSRPKGKGLSL